MNKDILLCGVGGQGIVLVSKLLAASAMAAGETVHSAETIGMAQRGGSVTSHIRIGESYSPLIPSGCASLMLAFERLKLCVTSRCCTKTVPLSSAVPR